MVCFKHLHIYTLKSHLKSTRERMRLFFLHKPVLSMLSCCPLHPSNPILPSLVLRPSSTANCHELPLTPSMPLPGLAFDLLQMLFPSTERSFPTFAWLSHTHFSGLCFCVSSLEILYNSPSLIKYPSNFAPITCCGIITLIKLL